MKFLFILVFISSTFHSFSQKVNLDTVLFSKFDNYVLMYDFYLQEKKSINVWNLYSSGNIHSELSIILDNNNYFKLNRPLLIDSNIIELQPLNIDAIIDIFD